MIRLLAFLLCFLPLAVRAEPPSCAALFAGGQQPALLNAKLAQRTHPLCFRAYAVLASGVTRGALWSAEHLTRQQLQAARGQERVNLFHPEDRLPDADRAELADYARSGFDRGHMAPSGDMPDAAAQEESFSLANMVPQAPELNRGVWERIETGVRRMAERQGELYVVTGPAFQGGDLRQLNDRVLVPSSTWKAIYDPGANEAGAYLCTNTSQPRCQVMSVTGLAELTGIDPFPALPAGTKAVAMTLRVPHARSRSD